MSPSTEYISRQSYLLWHGPLNPVSKSWIWCVLVISPYQWQDVQSNCSLDCLSVRIREFLDTGCTAEGYFLPLPWLYFLLNLLSGFWSDVKLKPYSLLYFQQNSKGADQKEARRVRPVSLLEAIWRTQLVDWLVLGKYL